MTMKRSFLILLATLCVVSVGFAGVETSIASLKGKAIEDAGTLWVADHHYGDMQTGSYSSWFAIKSS